MVHFLALVLCLVAQLCPAFCNPTDCSLPDSCPWGFSRQEFWSGLPCPPPGHLSNPGIESRSPTLQVDSLPSEPLGKPLVKIFFRASLVAQTVKDLPAMKETWFQSLGWEDTLEEGMATHSRILAWRIPMDRGAWRL